MPRCSPWMLQSAWVFQFEQTHPALKMRMPRPPRGDYSHGSLHRNAETWHQDVPSSPKVNPLSFARQRLLKRAGALDGRVMRAPPRRARFQSRSQRPALEPSQAGARLVSFSSAVPELTCSACIQLNERLSLRGYAKAIASSHRILSPSGPSTAKPSGDYIPLGGFVFSAAVGERQYGRPNH
jgi:hypothetical protein